ncbi:MAG: peptidyl-arginine deiminase, partial [Bacteroidales bacterium]|nr:peptidyl-arginine deiminase [Bacteroidales bacterium]
MKKTIIAIVLVCSTFCSFSQTDSTKKSNLPLTYWMNADELARKNEIGMNFRVTNPPEAPIINIAEFQPMQGVLVRYPFGIPVSLIAAMSQIVTVTTSISSANQQTTVENIYRSNGVNMNNVDFVIANTDSYCTRDYGPWMIIYGNDEFGV